MAERDKISTLLKIATGSRVAVVGCGGKTSLIELIAAQNNDKKVLITPTTKIFPMRQEGVTLRNTLEDAIGHVPQTGVQCLGQLNKGTGKLEALPEHVLANLASHYDIVLMEADGSRSLPCKGWRANEPVIPAFSTHTVGVVTMSALGIAATGEVVHNLEEFLTLTELCEGGMITEQALADMVCLPNGMFKHSVGHRQLIVNKAETKREIRIAESLLNNIKARYPSLFESLIYGSVRLNTWQEY